MKYSNNEQVKNTSTVVLESAVKSRYQEAAFKQVKELCCPTSYNPEYLKVIPQEILEKDYGCGDPSRFLKAGDTVLDLGSGAGKICYIASQIVGPKGKVIGIDFNPPMLSLARKYQSIVGDKIGWHNVTFLRGKIQDLKTDSDLLGKVISDKPIQSVGDYEIFQNRLEELRSTKPLIPDESIDCIVSNCVLNLVRPEDKLELFREMHRVLKIGGRVAISDIVSDEAVPSSLQRDPELWSGCISGAFQEKEFLRAFEEAGFYGIKIEKFDDAPWRTVEGIEFRSMTITAHKGKEGPCWERNQSVIYQGPWKEVRDDDHHILKRGVRTAVCDKTFQIFSKLPYRDDIILIQPKGKNDRKNASIPSNCLDGECC